MVTRHALERFRFETQVLGRLQHPGIAQIYDAGMTKTDFGDQPYFAMEYVRGTPLAEYVDDFYDLLEDRYDELPLGTQRMMPYMVGDNWLLSYAGLEGIGRVLNGLYRRTGRKSRMNRAIEDLEAHYTDFESDFFTFFPELVTFSRQKFDELCES